MSTNRDQEHAMDNTSVTLKLLDTSAWRGAFALLVKAAVEDILSDGEGFEARITAEMGTAFKVYEVFVSGVDEHGFITTREGYRFAFDEVVGLDF